MSAKKIEDRPKRTERVMVQLTTEEFAWVRAQSVKTNRSDSGVLVELVQAAREGRKPLISEDV